MGRYLFNIITLLSLGLFTAAALMWPRSYYDADSISYLKDNITYENESENGGVMFSWSNNSVPLTDPGGWSFETRPANPRLSGTALLAYASALTPVIG